jgi:hypothetical protein
MNNDPELIMELIEAYERKLIDLEKTVLPRLKENFQLYQSLFRSIYELFLQRGVVKADPYKNERHLSDIYSPEDPPMSEAEIEEQMPIKLSEFDNLLDFMNNYTQFKCSSLNLKKLKVLTNIVKYIDWGKMSSTNTHPATYGMSLLVDKLKMGSDNMATVSFATSQHKIEQVSQQLMKDLKALVEFKREEYRLFIRQRILPHVPGFTNNPSKDEFTKMVKGQFARAMEGEGFFPELVGELHDEVYTANPESVRKTILARLFVEESKKKVETQAKFNLRDILFEGTRALGTASRPIDESFAKLRENTETLKNRPRTLFERFREWVISLSAGGAAKEEIYEIEMVDLSTTMKRVERLEFNAFANTLQRKTRYLTSMLIKTSPTHAKLEQMKDEEIFDILEKNLVEVKLIHDRLEALDTYFKSETPVSERNKMKGIKVELGNLKNSIALVNQKLHEYVARKDELVQLKKLGIDVQE